MRTLPSSLLIGCSPPDTSMMASRVCARPTRPSIDEALAVRAAMGEDVAHPQQSCGIDCERADRS